MKKYLMATDFSDHSKRLTKHGHGGKSMKSGFAGISPADMLNALGLEGGQYKYNKGGAILSLGDGAWDGPTGGAIAIRTTIVVDDQNRVQRLTTRYLALNPAGDHTDNKLVEFDVRTLGGPEAGDRQKISKMTFLGRAIDTHSGDAMARVLGMLQQIHGDMRNRTMPDLGKALHDFGIAGLLGESMHLPGLGRQGGFDFKPVIGTNPDATSSQKRLPRYFIPELLGLGTNDFDPPQKFGSKQEKTGFDRQNGGAFRATVMHSGDDKSTQLTGAIEPLVSHTGKAITDLLQLNLQHGEKDSILRVLLLLGENSVTSPTEQVHKRLGVVNAMNRDLRNRKYPAISDHLAAFNQQDLLDRQALAGEIDGHSKMIVKVYGGHNAREYAPGFGGSIGGNSKGILSYSCDETGAIRVRGFRVDAGITFSKQGGIQAGEHGSFDRALPDPGADWVHLKHDLITHLHADHMQAIVDEARCGLQVGRTVHAGAYDIRVLQQFFKKERIAEELRPTLVPLDGEGWLHLNAGDNRLASAYYSTNAIPHSTPVVAYIIVPAPYKSDWQGRKTGDAIEINPHYWSYATLGDMSFGVYNLPGYIGEKPPDTGFKENFFASFKSGLKTEYPDLPVQMRRRVNRINVAECDPTSIHREGFAPDVVTFERNLDRLSNQWFPELGILMASLSTAKRQQEGVFRSATRSGRNLSGEGAYLENRMTDMNVMGVNTDVIPRNPEGDNINEYLKWYASKIKVPPVAFHRRTAKEWKNLVAGSPQKTLILMTGSQGTEVEQDSVGTQIAEGWSRFQLDPKYCRAAYGVDLKKYLIIYAQSAIPGNEDKQLDQVRKTAYENDLMVGVSVHDGARFYNLKEPYLSRIKADLDNSGGRYTEEPMNGLFLHGLALYPPGHGWKEDWRQGFMPWLKRNGVDMISVQHYPRLESVRITHALADEAELRHPDEPISNHVAWTIKNGRDFRVLGSFTPSFILGRTNRRFGKHHDGTEEYLHAVFPVSEGGLSNSGVFVAENGAYYNKFGPGDYERALHEATLPAVRSRRDPDMGMLETPPALGVSRIMPTRGMASPHAIPDFPHLRSA